MLNYSIIKDDKEHAEIHQSVKDAQSSSQGQGKVSLEECFKLYTQEEKVLYTKVKQAMFSKGLTVWKISF